MRRYPRSFSALAGLALATFLSPSAGCRGWAMDYGAPAAQFEARDAVAVAHAYRDQKVSVRGTVRAVDLSDPNRCVVELAGGVTAVFGDLVAQAAPYKVGEIACVDGFVAAATSAGVVLKPARSRDASAPFDPTRR